MIGTASLGAPGVYRASDQPLRTLTGVRMDVCAFVGVAPRGPVREPVKESPWPVASPHAERDERRSVPVRVESWSEYVRLFGGFSGPGLLPYAVHAFFRQGGRRAWVVRIVHEYGDVRDREGRATAPLTGLLPSGARGLPLRSAETGPGGDGIRVRASWDTVDLGLEGVLAGAFALSPGAEVVAGDLLRVELADGSLRFQPVESVRDDELAASPVRVAVPEKPVEGDPVAAVRVRVELTVVGGAGSESYDDLGLVPEHPRWLGRILAETSTLVRPDPRWMERDLRPASASLAPPVEGAPFRGGRIGRPARGAAPGLRVLGDGVWLEARSEGRWGDRLRASLSFRSDPVETVTAPVGDELGAAPDADVHQGTTLLLRYDDGRREVRKVVDVVDGWLADAPERVRRLVLDAAPSGPSDDLTRVERVEGMLRVREDPVPGGEDVDRGERFDGLGLSPDHPRWLHRVLRRESELIRPHEDWRTSELQLTPGILEGEGEGVASGRFRGGKDRYGDIEHADFFDDEWSPAGERPGSGIQAVGDLEEVALLVVPDLYVPAPLPPVEDVSDPVSLAGPEFAPCVHPAGPEEQAEPSPALEKLYRDPSTETGVVVDLQGRVADFADELRRFVALLDVPPGLSPDEVLRWRGRFGTDFAAAYHPWTEVALPEDGRSEPVRVNPAAVAAGIVARIGRERGVHHGPANVVARDVVRLDEDVPPGRHDVLHPRGINVFRGDPSGIRLSGARTLSRDPAYRQLSVRRLMSMLARTLEREMAWTAFEPNGEALRSQVTRLLTGFLRRLHRANALTGATEEEAFFVRCDETLNPQRIVDAGRLMAEVGVAPAEPAEYLVLRIARSPDGSVRAEA